MAKKIYTLTGQTVSFSGSVLTYPERQHVLANGRPHKQGSGVIIGAYLSLDSTIDYTNHPDLQKRINRIRRLHPSARTIYVDLRGC